MAYDPKRDKCLHDFGTFQAGDKEFRITLQRYDQSPPKLCIAQVYYTKRNGEWREQRINGIPRDLLPVLMERDIIRQADRICTEEHEVVALAYTEVPTEAA